MTTIVQCLVAGWLLAVMPWSLVLAQNRTVSGRVTGPDGADLPGVSVVLKNTQRGTTTAAGGRYSLPNLPDKATLTFSYIGYVSQDVVVGNRTTLDVMLQSDDRSLSEVVVVGYGTQRKIETTGSIASIKSADLVQTPVVNVAQGLQARISGVQVNQNSGSPGGNVSVRIRGTNSINGNSEPLYVVDGIQISNGGGITDVSPLSTINPNDIESVEILKDASASAIYGSRAANGVVLITTKRGKSGVTRVTFDSYYGVQRVNKTLPVLNAAEFAKLENEVFKNNFYPDPASLGEGINWQNEIFRQAPIQNHQLSINGGNDKTQLAMSLNFFDQDGIIISSSFKRYSLRLNLDHRISDRVKVGASILGSYSINDGITTGSETIGDAGVVTGSILGAALGAPPNLKPYRPDGTVFPFGEQATQYREVANPLGFAVALNERSIKRTLANVYGEANIANGLTYRASFNIDQRAELFNGYSPRSIVNRNDLNDNSGSAQKNNLNYMALLHESILTYATAFGKNHTLKGTAVFATQAELSNANNISATGFPNDATQNEAVQLGLTRTVNSSRSARRLDSYMGRINYGFRDKLFVDFTARIDGSSTFGANHKYGLFPAASVAWRVIEEPFLKSVSWLSDLKLRASYGITGNAGGINPYQSLATVSSSGSFDYNLNHAYVTGIAPTGIANPDLRWERSAQTNIGVDLSLFNNRLSLIADVYQKKTNDLLYVKALPLSSGYGTITGNFASLENKGIELAVNGRILNGPLKWDASANVTFNRNKVLGLDGGVTTERFVTTYTILKVGEPLGLFKTYVYDGVNQTGETILPGYDGRVGGHKLRDITGDGIISSADQTITGNPNPDFIYGGSTSLSFKGFDLSAFISGSQGNDIYNASRLSFENPAGQRNMLKGVVNRWSPTNPSNQYASAFVAGRLPISSYVVEDGSYTRLKNLSLGYTLPAIKGVQRIRVYVSGNNLFTLTNYSGFDPEVNTYAGSNTQIGIDNLVYPQAKSFLGGIQITL